MKYANNIKQELLLVGNDNTEYEVYITGNISISAGFVDDILVYGRTIEDDTIHLDKDFGSTNQIEKQYGDGMAIRIVRRELSK
jgi:hypothetical protein